MLNNEKTMKTNVELKKVLKTKGIRCNAFRQLLIKQENKDSSLWQLFINHTLTQWITIFSPNNTILNCQHRNIKIIFRDIFIKEADKSLWVVFNVLALFAIFQKYWVWYTVLIKFLHLKSKFNIFYLCIYKTIE